MNLRNVRVVVGHGDPPSDATIMDALDGEGIVVIGDASTPEDLARILRAESPDVVVLDDMIGVAAVQVVADEAPDARLVVVWPAAVLPIAGATRVDAAHVAEALRPPAPIATRR